MDVFIFVVSVVASIISFMVLLMASLSFMRTATYSRDHRRTFFESFVETNVSYFWAAIAYPFTTQMGRLMCTIVRDAEVPRATYQWYESGLDKRIDEWKTVCSLADGVILAHAELKRQRTYIRKYGDRQYERVCEKIMKGYTNGWQE